MMNASALVLLVLTAGAGTPQPVFSVRAPETIVAAVGESVEARISVTVAQGYHVQANPASEDYLIPTRLELKATRDIAVGKPAYPSGEPYRLSGADKDLQTYEGTFAIGIPVKIARNARLGRQTVEGRLHYQACDAKTCLPPASAQVTLTIEIVPGKSRPAPVSPGKR